MKKLIVKLMVLVLAQSSLVMSMYRPVPCKGGACGRKKATRRIVPAVNAKYGQNQQPDAPATRAVPGNPGEAEAPKNEISDLLKIFMNLLANEGNMPRPQYIFEIVPVMDEIINLVNPHVDEIGNLKNKNIADLFAQFNLEFGIFKAMRDSLIAELELLPKAEVVPGNQPTMVELPVMDQENEDQDLKDALEESKAFAESVEDSVKKHDDEDKVDGEQKEKSENPKGLDLNNTDLADALRKAINIPAAQAQVQRNAQEEKERNEEAELLNQAIRMSMIAGQAKDLNHVETPRAQQEKQYTGGIDRTPNVNVQPEVNKIEDKLVAEQRKNMEVLAEQARIEAAEKNRIAAEQKAREEARLENQAALAREREAKEKEEARVREQRLQALEDAAKGKAQDPKTDIQISGGFDLLPDLEDESGSSEVKPSNQGSTTQIETASTSASSSSSSIVNRAGDKPSFFGRLMNMFSSAKPEESQEEGNDGSAAYAERIQKNIERGRQMFKDQEEGQ